MTILYVIFFFESAGNQRLTALNGQAFANLHQLETIALINNYCINEMFSGDQEVATAHAVISSRCGYDELDSIEIACETFQDKNNFEFCIMTEKTAINATNFVIGDLKDEDIGGIDFNYNKAVEYLPYKIHMQLPNLVTYRAKFCSIKQISKENFEKLTRLKSVELNNNQIQKISGNTFQGLEKLLQVVLSKF